METEQNKTNTGMYMVIGLIILGVVFAIYILSTTNNLGGMRLVYQIRYSYALFYIITFILLLLLLGYIKISK